MPKATLPHKVASAFIKGLAAGWTASPLTTEIYTHRHLAHRTYELRPTVKTVSWLLSRAVGFSPTPWAIEHRNHHGNDSQVQQGAGRALRHAISTGYSTVQKAQTTLDNPKNRRFLLFPGEDEATDPIIAVDDEGRLTPKHQNKIDKILDKYPRIARFGLPLLTTAALSLARTQQGEPVGHTVITSAAIVAGFGLGQFGPGLIAAFPERRDGYNNPTEAGIDRNKVWQAVFGSYALHSAHHKAPYLSSPPGTFDRDSFFPLPLEALGLGKPHDGINGE